MLSKIVVFLVAFIGIFALLISGMAGFQAKVGQSLNAKDVNPDVKISETFRASDIYSYSNLAAGNINYSDSVFISLPDTDDNLELWWDYEVGYGDLFEVRHTHLGLFGWWVEWHCLLWKYKDGTSLAPPQYGGYMQTAGAWKYEIVNNYDSSSGGSAFYIYCEHYSASIVIGRRFANETISQSWDNHHLNYTLSYEFNLNSTSLNAFTVLSMIIGFTNPDLGIGGLYGSICNGVIATALWGARIYLLYKIIAGLIPFVSGGSGD